MFAHGRLGVFSLLRCRNPRSRYKCAVIQPLHPLRDGLAKCRHDDARNTPVIQQEKAADDIHLSRIARAENGQTDDGVFAGRDAQEFKEKDGEVTLAEGQAPSAENESTAQQHSHNPSRYDSSAFRAWKASRSHQRTQHASATEPRHSPTQEDTTSPITSAVTVTEDDLHHQLDLRSPADVLRRAFLRRTAPNRAFSINQRIRSLQRQASRNRSAPNVRDDNVDEGHHDAEHTWNGFPLEEMSPEEERRTQAIDLLKIQIRTSSSGADLVRVLTVAMQTPSFAQLIGRTDIQRHVSFRAAKLPLDQVPGALSVFQKRYEEVGHKMDTSLILVALKKAAGLHNMTALKHWLEALFDSGTFRHGKRMDSVKALVDILQALNEGLCSAPTQDRNTPGLLECLLGGTHIPKQLSLHPLIKPHLYHPQSPIFPLYVTLLTSARAPSSHIAQAFDTLLTHQPLESCAPRVLACIHSLFEVGDPRAAWPRFFQCIGQKDSQRLFPPNLELSRVLHENLAAMPRCNDCLRGVLQAHLMPVVEFELQDLEKNLGVAWVVDRPGATNQGVEKLADTKNDDTNPAAKGYHRPLALQEFDEILAADVERMEKSVRRRVRGLEGPVPFQMQVIQRLAGEREYPYGEEGYEEDGS
ncbi:MAG: hypothetical protein M1831_000149 [Alyxoria varia]|nr:MAG: hypothetical protein M1831_000149 [Alyxoria varia]